MSRRKTKPTRAVEPAAVPLRGTADILPQRVLPLADLLAVQALMVAGVVTALSIHQPGWYGLAAGFAVALPFVVPWRSSTLPRWLWTRWGFARQRRARRKEPTRWEPFDAALFDDAQIGFHWDGHTLLSLVHIEENPQAMTVMEPGVTVSGETVPVQLVADCLRQFDITLDSIDVISQGARSQGHGQIAAIYDAVLGPLPAIAQRSVWIAVRFDPTSCPDAVRRRGGGREGILRTAGTATRRVANRLTEAGLRPQIMTASEIAQATNQLADGVDLNKVDETWFTCKEGQFQLRSFAVEPSMFTTAGLGMLWTVPSYSTTVCVSLRRNQRTDAIQLRGLARFDSPGRTKVHLRGLSTLHGRQFAALVASLPLPTAPRTVTRWAHGRGDDAVRNMALPASGCGQVVGADDHGRAVALPLFGPRIRRVEMCGNLHLAQQVVLRSLALGARVRVHTRRAAAWRQMVDEVGDQTQLRVTDFNRGSMQAGSERNYTVEMFDGTAEREVRVGVTTMVVKPPYAEPSREADASLQLVDRDNDLVRVRTRTGSAMVTMVATDDEMRYLKSSFAMAD